MEQYSILSYIVQVGVYIHSFTLHQIYYILRIN